MRPTPARRLRPVLIALAVLSVVAWFAQPVPRLSAQETWRDGADVSVRYRIDARLVEDPHEDRWSIEGSESVTWRNTSEDDVQVVYLHLYPNAFLNTRSTMMREAALTDWEIPDDMQWGGLRVEKIALASGESLTLEYVSPDDGNPDDRTVARAVLPAPVLPGDTLELSIDFATLLPRVVRRMGRHRDFVMAAQWYPKLGRYVGTEGGGSNVRDGWYCHQYHWTSEFFADFADYTVSLTVPDEMVTGATGVLTDTERRITSLRTETYEARSVVDFAWTAHPRFVPDLTREIFPLRAPAGQRPADDPVLRERARIAKLLGREPADLTLPPVRVTLLLQPEHSKQADRHFEAARVALGLYGLWLGPYPYDRLTIVDPAHGAEAAGGMEYPMLVTTGTRIVNPRESLRPEGVTVHEIGHQWFMNVLASNEAEEAWLDEGLDTYFTARALHTAYGPALDTTEVMGERLTLTQLYEFTGLGAGWPETIGLPDWASPPRMATFIAWRDLPWLTALPTPRYIDDPLLPRRRSYLRSAGWDPMVRPAWEYVDRRSYGVNAYSRPALFVGTLRRTLHARMGEEEGEAAFVRGMREYGRRWRFRHPRAADFLTTFGEVSGLDAGALAAELTATSGVLDYAVESIRGRREPPLEGLVAEDGELVPVAADEEPRSGDEEPPKRSEVLVRRRGELVLPVRLTVERSGPGGEPLTETVEWDGRARWKRFEFDGEVLAARLYPHGEYLLDVDRRNDSRKKDADYRPGLKWGVRFLLWLENAALSYGRFL